MLFLAPCLRASRPEKGSVLLVSGVEPGSSWQSLCRAVGRSIVPVDAEPSTFLAVLDRSLLHASAHRDVLVQVPAGLSAGALGQLITVLRGSHVPVSEVQLPPVTTPDDAKEAAAVITAHLRHLKAGRKGLAGSTFDTTSAASGTTPSSTTTSTTTTTTPATTTTSDSTTTATTTPNAGSATSGTAAGGGSGGTTTTATPSGGSSSGGSGSGTSAGTTATTSGTSRSTSQSTSPTTGTGGYSVITNAVPGYNWYRKDRGVGSQNGGWCTCPDGNTFMVGDYNNDCKSLACEGGSAGACSGGLPSQYAGMKVTCGWPRSPPAGPSNCAVEGGLCHCNGTVTYSDAQGNATSKEVTSKISCTNAAFGTDPKPGSTKFCTCKPGQPVQCATDGGTCACNGTVYYGAGSNWTSITGTGSVACNKTTFGTDPSGLGSGNACWCARGYTKCADEGGTCTCNGSVQMGVGNFWTAPRSSTGQISCSTSVFGDPYWGRSKACYCLPGGQA